ARQVANGVAPRPIGAIWAAAVPKRSPRLFPGSSGPRSRNDCCPPCPCCPWPPDPPPEFRVCGGGGGGGGGRMIVVWPLLTRLVMPPAITSKLPVTERKICSLSRVTVTSTSVPRTTATAEGVVIWKRDAGLNSDASLERLVPT